MWRQHHLIRYWPDSLQDLVRADEQGSELLGFDGSPDSCSGRHMNEHVVTLGEFEVSPPLIRVARLPTLRSPSFLLNSPNLFRCLLHQLGPQRQTFSILMP